MASSGQSSNDSIRSLLEGAGLGHVAVRFEAEEITPPMLAMLDDRQLRDLGVYTVGQRLRLKLAVDSLVQAEVGVVEEGVGGVGGGVGLVSEASALDTLSE